MNYNINLVKTLLAMTEEELKHFSSFLDTFLTLKEKYQDKNVYDFIKSVEEYYLNLGYCIDYTPRGMAFAKSGLFKGVNKEILVKLMQKKVLNQIPMSSADKNAYEKLINYILNNIEDKELMTNNIDKIIKILGYSHWNFNIVFSEDLDLNGTYKEKVSSTYVIDGIITDGKKEYIPTLEDGKNTFTVTDAKIIIEYSNKIWNDVEKIAIRDLKFDGSIIPEKIKYIHQNNDDNESYQRMITKRNLVRELSTLQDKKEEYVNLLKWVKDNLKADVTDLNDDKVLNELEDHEEKLYHSILEDQALSLTEVEKKLELIKSGKNATYFCDCCC